jgi:hypothetical protein
MGPPLARASFVLAAALTASTECKRSSHARSTSFVRPDLPAGFVEQIGVGWRVSTPSTWNISPPPMPNVWVAVDPQPVEQFRASVNVVSEPFRGESYDYAKATEASLRRDQRVTVEAVREDVVDADPTVIVEALWSSSASTTLAYRTMQANLASRGTGYVVTCSVSANAFERYRSTCDAVLRSFAVER